VQPKNYVAPHQGIYSEALSALTYMTLNVVITRLLLGAPFVSFNLMEMCLFYTVYVCY